VPGVSSLALEEVPTWRRRRREVDNLLQTEADQEWNKEGEEE